MKPTKDVGTNNCIREFLSFVKEETQGGVICILNLVVLYLSYLRALRLYPIVAKKPKQKREI